MNDHRMLGPVAEALRSLLTHVDRNTCTHEDTTRGGTNWTICQGCGRKWADDEGGFVPYSDPKPVLQAREILDALTGEPSHQEADRVLSLFASIADGYDESEDDDHQVWKDFDIIGSSLPLKHFRAARSARDELRERSISTSAAWTVIGYARKEDVADLPFQGGRTSFWCNERGNAIYGVPVYVPTSEGKVSRPGNRPEKLREVAAILASERIQGWSNPLVSTLTDIADAIEKEQVAPEPARVPIAASVIADLDEVRRAVFGDVGDEPNVYADYDLCSELQGKMRRALACLTAVETPSTPSSRWAANGEKDPHGTIYDCERASLSHGSMTDDELANAVFLNPDIGNLTAAKERLRWLSRSLDRSLSTWIELGETSAIPGAADYTMASFTAAEVPVATRIYARRSGTTADRKSVV